MIRKSNVVKLFLLFLLTLLPLVAYADMVIGGERVYKVVKGDTIGLISAKLGVNRDVLVKENNLDINKYLQIGQEIRANTRKIVPEQIGDGIIVNIPDRMLYFFRGGSLARSFPVGLGMPSWRGLTRWRTPEGKFKVTGKRRNPTWTVPPSMQWKMRMEGKPVKTVVPPGPDNPLGRYAIDLSIPRVVIHETIWPNTVYQFRSHGCVRVLPRDMETFFHEVVINITGKIIYNPVKIAVIDNERVFLEVHRDVYEKVGNLNVEARRLIESKGVSHKVDWQKVNEVIDKKKGIAEDITL